MTSPYHEQLLGIRTGRDADGKLISTIEPDDNALGRKGVMHGGAVASLLEAAGFAAVNEALAARQGATGTVMDWQLVTTTVDYLRPGLAMPTHAQARFDKFGARSASVAAEAWNADRAKPVATAEMTFIFKPRA
jgi:uncharacterized protein (TIGR00369 family)